LPEMFLATTCCPHDHWTWLPATVRCVLIRARSCFSSTPQKLAHRTCRYAWATLAMLSVRLRQTRLSGLVFKYITLRPSQYPATTPRTWLEGKVFNWASLFVCAQAAQTLFITAEVTLVWSMNQKRTPEKFLVICDDTRSPVRKSPAQNAVTRTRRWMSLSAKPPGSTLVLASSTSVLPPQQIAWRSLSASFPFPLPRQ
jgi:hypothetical protein